MFPVNGWKMGVQKIMHASIRQLHSALLRINPLQNASILHMKIRMFFRQYPFQLKLDNGNGFVHFPAQLFLKSIVIGRIAMYFKYLAGIIPVNLHGKSSKRHHIDSITILQNIQIAVTDTITDHCGHTGSLSYSGAHPYHIMVSPLNIQRMIIHQSVHNKMRTGTSVIYIAKHMKVVYNQSLDQFSKSDNEVLCPADIYNGIHNGIVISLFIQNFCFLRDQLFDHICIIRRQCLTNLGSGIFGGSCLAHLNETVQSDLVPVLHIRLFFLHIGNFFLRVIHESCQGTLVTVA